VTSARRPTHLGVLLASLAFACAPIAGIAEKPCRPGCVDGKTRLVCGPDGPRAEKCPETTEPCAAPSCAQGECGFHPWIGAPCGVNDRGTCNEGYACIGPRTGLTAMRLHTCALADDGKVWCWGDNPYGELGDGTTEQSPYPTPVRLPLPAIDVSAGFTHTCAVVDDGSVYCWGNNTDGKAIPTSLEFDLLEPSRLEAPGTRFVRVSAAEHHTCAITDQSTVWCWGRTRAGECGVDGEALNVTDVGPMAVPGLNAVHSIDSGLAHTCAVRHGTPSLLCWGSNRNGDDGDIDDKLGPGAAGRYYSATPVPVEFPAQVRDVGIGYESTYAVVGDGKTYAWGSNAYLQLGTGTSDAVVDAPQVVETFDDSEQLVALDSVSDVLRSDGASQCVRMQDLSRASPYMCWGTSMFGNLGFGGLQTPQAYPKASTVLPRSAANLVRGEQHSCFTTEEEDVVKIECFGRNFVVGNGTTDRIAEQDEPAPVRWDPKLFERYLAR
jgi:hypothetical protein